MKELIIAFGLFLFIEGILYAIFPSKMKSMLKKLNEVSTNQLKQTPQFQFTTSCEGIDCIVNAATDFENPQTIGLYVGILLVEFLAVYRRGQTSAREVSMWEEEELEMKTISDDLADIPDAVSEEEEFEDDLELLEDLEDL